MKVDLTKYVLIDLLIDENNNIAIFSQVKRDNINKDVDHYGFTVATPIELKVPYTINELADGIEYAISGENNEPYFHYDKRKRKTYEEVYYNIKGFNKAMKGKKLIHVGWNDRWGKFAFLYSPDKRGYSYTGIKLLCLDDEADWVDFAESVITLINYDPKKDK